MVVVGGFGDRCSGDDTAAAGASQVAGRWIAGGLTTASRPSGPLRIHAVARCRSSRANPGVRARAPRSPCRTDGGARRIEDERVWQRERQWRWGDRRVPRAPRTGRRHGFVVGCESTRRTTVTANDPPRNKSRGISNRTDPYGDENGLCRCGDNRTVRACIRIAHPSPRAIGVRLVIRSTFARLRFSRFRVATCSWRCTRWCKNRIAVYFMSYTESWHEQILSSLLIHGYDEVNGASLSHVFYVTNMFANLRTSLTASIPNEKRCYSRVEWVLVCYSCSPRTTPLKIYPWVHFVCSGFMLLLCRITYWHLDCRNRTFSRFSKIRPQIWSKRTRMRYRTRAQQDRWQHLSQLVGSTSYWMSRYWTEKKNYADSAFYFFKTLHGTCNNSQRSFFDILWSFFSVPFSSGY